MCEMEKSTRNTLQQMFWYFIIFSIIGLLLETLYCYATMGIIESRKGLIWGPFCPVYGIGAIVFLVALQHYKGGNVKLFFYGVLIGSIAEYVMSYMLEAVYGSRFWQYVENDINGRICLTYSVFWGLLAILLIRVIKPIVDKWITKITAKIIKPVEIGLAIFLVVDCLCTVWAIITYNNRVIHQYHGEAIRENIENANGLQKVCFWIEDTLFSNDIMRRTFPNLRLMDYDGKEYFVRDILQKIEERETT